MKKVRSKVIGIGRGGVQAIKILEQALPKDYLCLSEIILVSDPRYVPKEDSYPIFFIGEKELYKDIFSIEKETLENYVKDNKELLAELDNIDQIVLVADLVGPFGSVVAPVLAQLAQKNYNSKVISIVTFLPPSCEETQHFSVQSYQSLHRLTEYSNEIIGIRKNEFCGPTIVPQLEIQEAVLPYLYHVKSTDDMIRLLHSIEYNFSELAVKYGAKLVELGLADEWDVEYCNPDDELAEHLKEMQAFSDILDSLDDEDCDHNYDEDYDDNYYNKSRDDPYELTISQLKIVGSKQFGDW